MPFPLPYVVEDEATQGNFDEIKKLVPISRKHLKLESPHVVGAANQPAFENSWVNFDAGTFQAARYWKDPVDVVHLEGLVKLGTVGLTVFVLPSGYRPASGHSFAVVANNAIARVDVASTGNVVMVNGSNVWVQLSGINFRQEQ